MVGVGVLVSGVVVLSGDGLGDSGGFVAFLGGNQFGLDALGVARLGVLGVFGLGRGFRDAGNVGSLARLHFSEQLNRFPQRQPCQVLAGQILQLDPVSEDCAVDVERGL